MLEKGGWAENPIDRAQLTYLNLSVWALSKLIKSYPPTCSDSGGEGLEVQRVSIPGRFVLPRNVGILPLIPD